jgi:hypothetical protein
VVSSQFVYVFGVLCCRRCAGPSQVVTRQLQEWTAGVPRGAQGLPHTRLCRRMCQRLLLAGELRALQSAPAAACLLHTTSILQQEGGVWVVCC